MTRDLPGILNAITRSLTDPADAARDVLKTQWDRGTLWTGFVLVSVLNALFQGVLQMLVPGTEEQFMVPPPPLVFAVLMTGFLVLNTYLTFAVGRAWGGQGSFDDTLTLMVWFQIVSLALTAVQFVLMLVTPLLGVLFALLTLGLMVRCMILFVDVLHGFDHMGKAFGTAAAAFFAAVLAGMIVLPLIGIQLPQGVQ